jgi:hypothetical protein
MVLIQKEILCRLNIIDVNKQYCSDYKKMRMDELKKQFTGYCSHGLLITNIIEIIQSSRIRTNSKTLEGGMHLDITAKVEGIIYEIDEIIPDAKIAKITDTLAIATTKYASININIGKVSILKVGDITPVVVRLSQYNKFTDKVAVVANLFVPSKPTYQLFICYGDYIEDLEIKYLLNKIEEINKNINNLSSDEKKSLEYFNKLIYPFNTVKKLDKLSITNNNDKLELKLTKLKLNDIKNNLLLYNTDKPYLDDFINSVDNKFNYDKDIWKVDNQVLVTIKNNTSEIYKMLLISYYKKLYTLLELVKTYPNKEDLEKSKHIWKFYEINRIE